MTMFKAAATEKLVLQDRLIGESPSSDIDLRNGAFVSQCFAGIDGAFMGVQ